MTHGLFALTAIIICEAPEHIHIHIHRMAIAVLGIGEFSVRGVFGDGIQVRKQGEVTSSDHLDRARTALDAGELAESIEHIRAADPEIQPVFTDWMDNAENRHVLEQTLEALRLTMIAEERP